MSLIITCATQNRVVVKCDGRARDGETDEIISEDIVKFKRINENCIIGHGGELNFCELTIDAFIKLLGEGNPFEHINIFQYILQNTTIDEYLGDFIVTGKNNGKIILWSLGYKDNYSTITDNSPTDNTHIAESVVLGCKEIDDTWGFWEMYDKEISLETNMNAYIRRISLISPSVNDHISTAKISI